MCFFSCLYLYIKLVSVYLSRYVVSPISNPSLSHLDELRVYTCLKYENKAKKKAARTRAYNYLYPPRIVDVTISAPLYSPQNRRENFFESTSNIYLYTNRRAHVCRSIYLFTHATTTTTTTTATLILGSCVGILASEKE